MAYYKIKIMPPAKRRLSMYIGYTRDTLKNPEAAKAIANDARLTKKRLSEVAKNLAFCEDEQLAQLGYRKIRFIKHAFVMIYRIKGSVVYVDGMFHESQDYESVFSSEIRG